MWRPTVKVQACLCCRPGIHKVVVRKSGQLPWQTRRASQFQGKTRHNVCHARVPIAQDCCAVLGRCRGRGNYDIGFALKAEIAQGFLRSSTRQLWRALAHDRACVPQNVVTVLAQRPQECPTPTLHALPGHLVCPTPRALTVTRATLAPTKEPFQRFLQMLESTAICPCKRIENGIRDGLGSQGVRSATAIVLCTRTVQGAIKLARVPSLLQTLLQWKKPLKNMRQRTPPPLSVCSEHAVEAWDVRVKARLSHMSGRTAPYVEVSTTTA